MADFPTEAVSKIVSSVVPPKAYAYLAPFLPGLFFEVSVFLANPELVQQLIVRSNQATFIGKYSQVFIAVFLAFVIGHALILWVGFVHRILDVIYRAIWYIWRGFCIWPVAPVLSRLTAGLYHRINQQTWLGRRSLTRWLHRTLSRTCQYAQEVGFGSDLSSRGARQLWAILTMHVYKKRFGIDLNLDQEEWNALYEASRNAQLVQLGNHLLMLASQALGWAGIVAIRFAPRLANRNYIIFCVFMVAIGVLYDWWLIGRMHDSFVLGVLKLRALFRDLNKPVV